MTVVGKGFFLGFSRSHILPTRISNWLRNCLKLFSTVTIYKLISAGIKSNSSLGIIHQLLMFRKIVDLTNLIHGPTNIHRIREPEDNIEDHRWLIAHVFCVNKTSRLSAPVALIR